MASYGTVKYGARGDSVAELQRLLNQYGANLSVDGIFGDNTLAAVRNYQASRGLSVDGIVGTNTWGALTGTGGSYGYASEDYSPTATPAYLAYADKYAGGAPAFTPSDKLNEAGNLVTQYEQNRPGAYESPYQAQIDELLAKIQGREAFTYDFNDDPLYGQYRDNYQRLGQQAMQDTMGSAAQLSGGYGNSYATTAANQAYQQYLGQLNNVIPTLRDAAYGMYRDQGMDMYNEMGLLQGLEGTAYGRYSDDYNRWLTDRDYYAGREDSLYGREYGAYTDAYDQWLAERSYAYQAAYDAQQQANWQQEYNLAASKSSGGSGKKTGGGTNWDAWFNTLSSAQKQAALYGYTADGAAYMQQIVKEVGQDGLNALRQKYGGTASGGSGSYQAWGNTVKDKFPGAEADLEYLKKKDEELAKKYSFVF